MNQCLDTRLIQMSNVRSGLSSFLSSHDLMRIDGSECVDDDFTTNGLDGVDDDGYGAGVELFEGLRGGGMAGLVEVNVTGRDGDAYLLSVDINVGEPTSESRMRMIPTNDHLRSA